MNCEISLFGPMAVSVGDRRVAGTGFGGRRPRQVLALLALSAGRPVARDELADQLWEGRPPGGYVNTLQGYVCVLRRALTAIGAGHCLTTTRGGYVVDHDGATVDLGAARRRLVDGDLVAVLDGLELAAGGLLLEDRYATWADRARIDWDEELAEAALRAAARANASGDHLAAIRLARAAQSRAPYSEGALRELMRALAGAGETTEALQAFHVARQRLRADLAVEPQPATRELYLELLGATHGGASEDAPLLVSLLLDSLRDRPRPSQAHQEAWDLLRPMLLTLAG